MSREPRKLLTFEQVMAIPPGTPTDTNWVNDFEAVVSGVRAPSNGWTEFDLNEPGGERTIRGSARDRDMSEYEGKLCRFSGSCAMGSFKGQKKVTVFAKCNIIPSQTAQETPIPANSRPNGGSVGLIPGPTVGLALKMALEVVQEAIPPEDLMDALLNDPAVWRKVWGIASDIIRLSKSLEAGNLLPGAKGNAASTPAPKPSPPPATASTPDSDFDSVPF